MRAALVFLFAIALVVLTACRARSPSEAFLISDNKIKEVEEKAEAGDLEATKQLIAHYEVTSQDSSAAEKWRVRARALGDADELYYYAARLFTEARAQADREKKDRLLAVALEAADRSYKLRKDESTLTLIKDIKKASKGE